MIAFDEHRRRTAVEDDVRGGDPGEGGNDHFIARTDSEPGKGQVQSGGA